MALKSIFQTIDLETRIDPQEPLYEWAVYICFVHINLHVSLCLF